MRFIIIVFGTATNDINPDSRRSRRRRIRCDNNNDNNRQYSDGIRNHYDRIYFYGFVRNLCRSNPRTLDQQPRRDVDENILVGSKGVLHECTVFQNR